MPIRTIIEICIHRVLGLAILLNEIVCTNHAGATQNDQSLPMLQQTATQFGARHMPISITTHAVPAQIYSGRSVAVAQCGAMGRTLVSVWVIHAKIQGGVRFHCTPARHGCRRDNLHVGAFCFSGCRPARANGWWVDGSVGLFVIGWDGVWVGDEFLRHEAGP